MNGCSNCRYCKCYTGDRWTPDDYECLGFERDTNIDLTQEQFDEIMDRVWTDGKEWENGEEPLCPAWKVAPEPEQDYWERYAYEENRWDKDE